MRPLLFVLPMLAACPPPDEVDLGLGLQPSIELLYPPPTEPLVRQIDGTIEFLVVVDIDGMIFDKSLAGTEPTEGTGHYHLWIESAQIASPDAFSHDVAHLSTDTPNLASADEVHVRVSLQHNDHSDYDVDADGTAIEAWEAIVAYDIIDE